MEELRGLRDGKEEPFLLFLRRARYWVGDSFGILACSIAWPRRPVNPGALKDTADLTNRVTEANVG